MLAFVSAIAAVSSPIPLDAMISVCDRVMAEPVGQEFLAEDGDLSDIKAYLARGEARHAALVARRKELLRQSSLTPEQQALGERICETKLLSFIEGMRVQLSRTRLVSPKR
jgi:hypothetical protein